MSCCCVCDRKMDMTRKYVRERSLYLHKGEKEFMAANKKSFPCLNDVNLGLCCSIACKFKYYDCKKAVTGQNDDDGNNTNTNTNTNGDSSGRKESDNNNNNGQESSSVMIAVPIKNVQKKLQSHSMLCLW